MAKPQKSTVWLNKAVCKRGNRPVLTSIFKTLQYTVAADGYRMHVEYLDNDYVNGLNETKSSKKHNTKLEGRYPDVIAIVGKQNSNDVEFTFDAKKMIQAVKLAMVFAKDNADSVKFQLAFTKNSEGVIDVIGKSPERGDCSTRVAIGNVRRNHHFENVALNGKFVLDALQGLKYNKTVTAKLSATDPNFFLVPEQRLAVIMPLAR